MGEAKEFPIEAAVLIFEGGDQPGRGAGADCGGAVSDPKITLAMGLITDEHRRTRTLPPIRVQIERPHASPCMCVACYSFDDMRERFRPGR